MAEARPGKLTKEPTIPELERRARRRERQARRRKEKLVQKLLTGSRRWRIKAFAKELFRDPSAVTPLLPPPAITEAKGRALYNLKEEGGLEPVKEVAREVRNRILSKQDRERGKSEFYAQLLSELQYGQLVAERPGASRAGTHPNGNHPPPDTRHLKPNNPNPNPPHPHPHPLQPHPVNGTIAGQSLNQPNSEPIRGAMAQTVPRASRPLPQEELEELENVTSVMLDQIHEQGDKDKESLKFYAKLLNDMLDRQELLKKLAEAPLYPSQPNIGAHAGDVAASRAGTHPNGHNPPPDTRHLKPNNPNPNPPHPHPLQSPPSNGEVANYARNSINDLHRQRSASSSGSTAQAVPHISRSPSSGQGKPIRSSGPRA